MLCVVRAEGEPSYVQTSHIRFTRKIPGFAPIEMDHLNDATGAGLDPRLARIKTGSRATSSFSLGMLARLHLYVIHLA